MASPKAERSDGGQRLYNVDIIRHLRLVNDALRQGFRPKQVIPMSLEDLQNIMGSAVEHPIWEGIKEINVWLGFARNLEGESLETSFQSCVSHIGLLKFMTDRLIPFLELMGKSWSEDTLEIYQEHFASQRILDFLTRNWCSLSDRVRTNKSIICAALPGEKHFLGLHMAATVSALYGFKVIFLGPKTPEIDIQTCALQSQAQTILLSVSITTDKDIVQAQIQHLRQILPPSVTIVIGGAGAPLGLLGNDMHVISNLHELALWCQKQAI